MTVTAAQLLVKVNADTSAAEQGIGGLATLLGPGGVLGIGAIGAALAVAGVGIASTKMAADFQTGITSLVTGAGLARDQVGMVSQGILQLATDTGTSTSQLIAGMYMISSAGFPAGQAMDILRAAAEGAKVGSADLGTVADATTTILKDFAGTGITATQAVNELVATVANGKTHMQDLSMALSSVLPTAAAAGVGLNDVMGAMATMTGEGVPAADAATHLRQMIIALEAPSSTASKALEAVGLSSTEVAAEMHKSLPDTIALITDAIGKKFPVGSAGYVAAVKNISGGMREMQGMLQLSGTHIKDLHANVLTISGAVKNGGDKVRGWADVQATFNQTLSVFVERAETGAIKLGTMLLPAATAALRGLMGLGDTIGKVSGAIANWITWLNQGGPAADAVKGVLVLLGGALLGFGAYLLSTAIPAIIASVAAFGAQAVAAGAAAIATLAAAAPFILIGIAIAAVAIGIYELITHWKEVSAFLTGVWKAVVSGVTAGFHWVAEEAGLLWRRVQMYFNAGVVFVQGLIRAGFNLIKTIIFGQIEAIVSIFLWLYNHNYYFKALVDNIVAVFNRARAFIVGVWTTIVDWVSGAWAKIVGTAKLYFELVYVEIEARILRVKTRLQAIWTTIHDDVVAVGTRIWTAVTDAWNRVTTFIANLLTPIGHAVKSGVIDPITNTITGLITTAESWGANLLKTFIKGIQSQAGALKDAATKALGGLAKILGFHSPAEEGPGADADTWAPNLMRMFAQGLVASAPQLAAAAAQAMGGMKAALSTGAGAGASGSLSLAGGLSPQAAAGLLAPSAGTQLAQQLAAAAVGGGPAGGSQHATLVLDGRVLAQVIWPYLAREARLATGIRS